MVLLWTRRCDGDTRASAAEYTLDELATLAGPATHADLVWTGTRWLVELLWRGEAPLLPDGVPDHDGGPVLRRRRWEVMGMPPDYGSVGTGYRPRDLICSWAFREARAAVLAHRDCGPRTSVLARIDDPTLA